MHKRDYPGVNFPIVCEHPRQPHLYQSMVRHSQEVRHCKLTSFPSALSNSWSQPKLM